MKSKSIVSKSVVVSKVLANGAGVTDPLPHADPPAPPEGFVASRLGRGVRPQRTQIELAPQSANELHASTEYAKQFGDSAPDKGEVADALTVARAWSDKLQKAANWHAYVAQQEHRAWKHALALTSELEVLFAFRMEREPKLKKQYPSLSQFLAVKKASAKRAVVTRKAKEKGKQKGEGKAASPPPSPSPSSSGTGLAPIDPLKAAAVKLLN